MNSFLYTDGAARGNPGPGGWGFVLVLENSDSIENISLIKGSGSLPRTTNNAMELSAVVFGVEAFLEHTKLSAFDSAKIEACLRRERSVAKRESSSADFERTNADSLGSAVPKLEIRLDSKYVRDGAMSWRHGWARNGWQTKEKQSVSNLELWQRLHELLNLCEEISLPITWTLIRGHRGIRGNEMCDVLATTAADTQSASQIAMYPVDPDFDLDEFLHIPEPVEPYYITLVDGVVQKFTTWESCSQYVQGKKARYKKVHSVQEEQSVLSSWGI
jgi:ribonuclease HI